MWPPTLLLLLLAAACSAQTDSPVPPAFDCSGRPDGDHAWFANGPCEHDYARCTGGSAARRTCGDVLYFDPETGLCLERAFIRQCGGSPTPSPTPPDTPAPTPPAFDCSKLVDGLYSWFEQGPCEHDYAECKMGVLIRRTCGAVLYFDPISTECLEREYVEQCGGTATTPFEPQCVNDVLVPGGACTPDYVECVAGLFVERTCAGELVFDPASGSCQERRLVPGCPTTPPPFDCSKLADGLYSWFEQGPCEHDYAECKMGALIRRTCGMVLFFDPISGRCLQRQYVAQCGGTPTTTTKSTTPSTTTTTTTTTTTPTTTTTTTTPTPPPTQPETPSPTPPAFDCRKLPDGLYAWFVDGPCEHDYAQCKGGVLIRRTCGQVLYFDPATGRCDSRDQVAQCGGGTTQGGTPSPPTPPTTFDCGRRPDGLYAWFPDGQCEHDYAECSGGKLITRTCGAVLYFDPLSKLCLERQYVEQCGGKATPGTTQGTGVTVTESTPDPRFDCSQLPDGDYPWYANGPCEQEYATCLNGELISRRCPADLYFDPATGLCLYARFVATCGGIATTIAPTKPSVTKTPVDFDCSRLPDGNYLPPGTSCSPFYYSCSGGVASLHYCGALNTFYDVAGGRCQFPHCLPQCGGHEKACKALPPPIETGGEQVAKVGKPFDCRYLEDGDYVLFSGQCERVYASCVGGRTYYRLCQAGLYFDDATDSCLQLQCVIACGGQACPTDKTPDGTVIPPVGFTCGELPNGYYSVPSEPCSRVFYSCSGGAAHVHRCAGASTYWDDVSQSCQFAVYTPACGGQSTVPTVATTTPAPATPHPFDCAAHDDGDYAWTEGGCDRLYASCTGGKVTPRLCPSGLSFDTLSGSCLRPQYVLACGGTPTTTTTAATSSVQTDVGFDCHLKAHGNYEDPSSPCSNVFFTCSPVGAVRAVCPGNTYYDATLDLCDYFTDVPACTGTPRPVSDEPPTEKPAPVGPPADFDCGQLSDGRYEASSCVNYFYECYKGQSYVVHCGTDLLRFSKTDGDCVAQSKNADC